MVSWFPVSSSSSSSSSSSTRNDRKIIVEVKWKKLEWRFEFPEATATIKMLKDEIYKLSRIPPQNQNFMGLVVLGDKYAPITDNVRLHELKRVNTITNTIKCHVRGPSETDVVPGGLDRQYQQHQQQHQQQHIGTAAAAARGPPAPSLPPGVSDDFVKKIEPLSTEIALVSSELDQLQHTAFSLPKEKHEFEVRKLDNHLMNQMLKLDGVPVNSEVERSHRKGLIREIQMLQSELDKELKKATQRHS